MLPQRLALRTTAQANPNPKATATATANACVMGRVPISDSMRSKVQRSVETLTRCTGYSIRTRLAGDKWPGVCVLCVVYAVCVLCVVCVVYVLCVVYAVYAVYVVYAVYALNTLYVLYVGIPCPRQSQFPLHSLCSVTKHYTCIP